MPKENSTQTFCAHIYSGHLHDFPQDVRECQGRIYTYGDFHGNVLLVVNSLLQDGVLKTSESVYKSLVQVVTLIEKGYSASRYKISQQDFTSQYLNAFDSLMKHVHIIEPMPKGLMLRFLGDMLCDRGQNDLLMLRLYKKFHEGGLPYEIAFSNHDESLVTLYHNKYTGFGSSNYPGPMTIRLKMGAGQQLSLERMIASLRKCPKLIDPTLNDIAGYYLTHLQLICYARHEDCISVCTHAPFDLDDILELGCWLWSKLYSLQGSLPVSAKNILGIDDFPDCMLESADNFEAGVQALNGFFMDPECKEIVADWLLRLDSTDKLYELIWSRKKPNYDRLALDDKTKLVFFHGHDDRPTFQGKTLDHMRGKFSPWYVQNFNLGMDHTYAEKAPGMTEPGTQATSYHSRESTRQNHLAKPAFVRLDNAESEVGGSVTFNVPQSLDSYPKALSQRSSTANKHLTQHEMKHRPLNG